MLVVQVFSIVVAYKTDFAANPMWSKDHGRETFTDGAKALGFFSLIAHQILGPQGPLCWDHSEQGPWCAATASERLLSPAALHEPYLDEHGDEFDSPLSFGVPVEANLFMLSEVIPPHFISSAAHNGACNFHRSI